MGRKKKLKAALVHLESAADLIGDVGNTYDSWDLDEDDAKAAKYDKKYDKFHGLAELIINVKGIIENS